MISIYIQVIWLLMLSVPVACVAWTITHEEVFREPREYCIEKSKISKTLFKRKVYYLFTCEYCFSHYVALFFILFTDFHLLISDWRGYVLALFSLVWIANIYMSLFAHIRQDIKKEKTEIQELEKKLKE